MRVGFDGDDQLNSVGGDSAETIDGVDSMEMEGIGYVVESRPLFDPIFDFYRYPCIGPPADYAIVLLRAWAKKEYVDPKRIGIWGWVSLVFS